MFRAPTREHVLEALLHELVRAADQVEAIDVVELCRDLAAKEPPGAARGHRPGFDVLRVAPHEVTEGALVRDLAHPLYRPHLRALQRAGMITLCLSSR